MKTSHAIAISLAFTGVAVAFNASVLIGDPIKDISGLIPATYPSTTVALAEPIDAAAAPVKKKRQSTTTVQTLPQSPTTTVTTAPTAPTTTTTQREREEDDD